jgi:hypothetical protein
MEIALMRMMPGAAKAPHQLDVSNVVSAILGVQMWK